MVVSKKTIDDIKRTIIEWQGKFRVGDAALAVLFLELRTVEGNKSFKDTIQLLNDVFADEVELRSTYQLAIDSPDGVNKPWISEDRLLTLYEELWYQGCELSKWTRDGQVFYKIITNRCLNDIKLYIQQALGDQGPVWDLTDITFE